MKLTLIFMILIAVTALSADNAAQFLAADQSLMTLPTAYTMPKGRSALTNFELVLMQYSYAITDRAHLSAAMVFPFNKDMIKTFSAGGKYNYYRGDKLQAALWGSYTPDPAVGTLGNIFSYGNPKLSGHLITAGVANLRESEVRMLIGLGGIVSLSPRVSLIGESYYVPGNVIDIEGEDELNDDIKIILMGVRFRGDKISWDLGAGRPLEDMGDILALPFVKATFMF